MKKILLLPFLIFTSFIFSQQEASNWCFGGSGGLRFLSDGSTVPLARSAMTAQNGCATISDANGNLLFYSNGEDIFNRNHQIMANGSKLFGNFYSTQSVFIVKKPGSSNLFYVFTLDQVVYGKGFRYSEVDMNLDGGLGAVTATKNVLIYAPSCEKIAVVNHANGVDYWIVTHGWENNTFYSHLVTAAGISAIPVLSSTGSPIKSIGGLPRGASGGMKIAPDGSKLAMCNRHLNIELFDFDTTTGNVSNPNIIFKGFVGFYSVEFSSNSKVLYASIDTDGVVFQFDLNKTNIASSRIEIAKTFGSGDLQLGINHKIYLTAFKTSSKLSVINNPDIVGKGCNFQYESVPTSASLWFGLPVFCASIFNQAITVKKLCLGDNTTFALTTTQFVTAALWNFGDGTTSSDVSPTHIYEKAGTYTVSVSATSASGTGVKTRVITISAVPTATKPQNILICDPNNDGFSSFDLTTQNTAILNGQDPNLYTIKYFANATDYANNIAIASPNNYVNTTKYQAQTIIAEISNNANSECKSSTNFDINVFDSPKPNTIVPKISSCDNASVGNDSDGRILFDLTQRATTILNGQSASQFVLSYYKDVALTQGIPSPSAYANSTSSETIYVKMVNKDNINCFATTSFLIEVLAFPVITNVVDLKQCDDDIDGYSVFNLEEAIAKITTNAANETITFFRLATDAQNNTNPITNPTTYTNQTVSTDAVYARVTNANGCFRIATVNLFVSTTQIPLNYAKTFIECDDAVLGTNTDGVASFDFSGVTAEVRNQFPVGQLLDIRYFRNLADALAEKNAITDISNYRNIGYPNTQKIYIRVDSQVNNDCLGLGSHITLNVERIPIVKPLTQIHCDDDQDGKFAFDTTNLETQLLNGLTNVSVAYFDQNNVPLSSPLPNPFLSSSQKLRVIVNNTTSTACSYESSIDFVVDDLPEAFPVPTSLTTTCDDEVDPNFQDGKFAFDTSTFEKTILGTQTGMTVNYFDGNNNPLPSPLRNPFVTATQNVKVEVINPVNKTCTATLTLPFIVNPIPKIALIGDELVCSDLPSFTKVLDAGLLDGSPTTDYSYVWSFNGKAIVGETNYTLTVNTAGLYTVKVTNVQGCSGTRTFTVVASDKANITEVKIVDLAESNSITVSIAASLGDYVYALNDEFGVYQKENIFTNVSAGIHTVYVKDLNGCGIKDEKVAVLGIPNFFTPNDDGYNDYWNIKGVNASFNAKSIIYIFDRFGKLIKQISPLTQGWDGTFNGQPMPATDYWYSIQLEDGRVFKGHFALKR